MRKLFVFDGNTWYHRSVFKQMIIIIDKWKTFDLKRMITVEGWKISSDE